MWWREDGGSGSDDDDRIVVVENGSGSYAVSFNDIVQSPSQESQTNASESDFVISLAHFLSYALSLRIHRAP